jgi:Calcineurin-like phosphoesterase
MRSLTRRSFLASASLATAWPCARAQSAEPLTSFFVVGDTHFRAKEESPAEMEPDSLPGTEMPAGAGGGLLPAVNGVLHVGDLVDSGDKNGQKYEEMQRTEWDAYVKAFGRDGGDGALKWPVFDLPGNHDSPSGKGQIIDRLVERNRGRKDLKAISANGLHYSWARTSR